MVDKCSSALMTVRIIEMLKEADRSNPITQAEIAERLGVDRKTVWRAFLNLEREMNFIPGKVYGKGYYYKRRSEELTSYEVRLLIDAVASSRVVGKKESAKLISKLAKLLSAKERQLLLKSCQNDESMKSERESVLLNIDMLGEAMCKRRQAVFEYRTDTEGAIEKYTVSPGRTLFFEGLYLLIAKDATTGTVRSFRIDRLSNIGILETVPSEVTERELRNFRLS